MPNTSYRASGQNTYDEMSDVERAQEAARAAAADYAARYGLQSQIAQAEVAKQALANQGMLGAADIGARSASEVANLHNIGALGAAQIGATSAKDVAGIGAQSAKDIAETTGRYGIEGAKIAAGPQQTIADLQKQRYAMEREDTAGQREFDKSIWNRISQQMGGGPQSGFNVGQAPPKIDDLIAMGIAMKTGNPMALPGAGLRQASNQAIANRIAAGELEIGPDGSPVETAVGRAASKQKSLGAQIGMEAMDADMANKVMQLPDVQAAKQQADSLIEEIANPAFFSKRGLQKELLGYTPDVMVSNLSDKWKAIIDTAAAKGVPRQAVAALLKQQAYSKFKRAGSGIDQAILDVADNLQ